MSKIIDNNMAEEIAKNLNEMIKHFEELQNKVPIYKKWLPTLKTLLAHETRREGI
jgi:DNA-binding HxlR family transcriptional regulator